MVRHASPVMLDFLGKHVDVVPAGKLFHQRNRVAFCATASGRKDTIQNCNAQSFIATTFILFESLRGLCSRVYSQWRSS